MRGAIRDDSPEAPPAPPSLAPRPSPVADRAGGTAVELALESRDPVTGVLLRQVVVDDCSVHSPTRAARQHAITAQDALLRANPSWGPPRVVDGELVVDNEVSRWLYSAPGLVEWRRDMVPTARALYPMQRPHDPLLPSGSPVDEVTSCFFTNSLDAIGIRTRAAVMTDLLRARAAGASGAGAPGTWVSLACGAAVPVLDALASLGPTAAHLHLVDLDPDALAFAARLATADGLREGVDFTVVQRNLVSTIIARDTLVAELGAGSADVVDALGIFEYLSDASCVRLLRNAAALLRPGGVLVVANMLSDRREISFNQRGVGWPHIVPRSVEEVVELVRRAGLPLERTTVSIPQDGVYAVVDITR